MRPVAWLILAAVLGIHAVPIGAAELELRIVYDESSAMSGVRTDFGFSALVDFRGHRILFDSGNDAAIFLHNLDALRVDPASITHAVISNRFPDHITGIYRLALKNQTMKVYFLDSFPDDAFEVAEAVGMEPIRVSDPMEIEQGVYTTGIVEGDHQEQALLLETSKGLVVLTGCAYPGVVKMVEVAQKQRNLNSVRLLAGGFHMMRESEDEIRLQLERLQQLGVEQVMPMHCTGERAMRLFRRTFGSSFVPGGVGRQIVME